MPDPADERADAREQDRERERLLQVVVGTGVESLRLVEVAVLGREHQDRRPVAGRSEVAADDEAVAARQHDVEDHDVVAALLGHPEPVVAVVGAVDRESLGLQAAPQRRGDLEIVLDDQQLHGLVPPGPDSPLSRLNGT